MSQTPRYSLTKTTPLQPQSPSIKENMIHKSSTIASAIPEKIAANSPAEIGDKGTVGSLIMREIEYFSRLELGPPDIPRKPPRQITKIHSSVSSYSKPKLGSLIVTAKQKKRRSKRFIPSMCSMVEVADRNQPNSSSGFGYKNLKSDTKRVQV